MYSALFLAALSYALVTANWLIALTCIGSVWVMYQVRIDDEESMMLAAFGEQYRELMRTTGRLIPRL
jgi:protein-S-isoprenylcysteine O-methyltransferase Ste14